MVFCGASLIILTSRKFDSFLDAWLGSVDGLEIDTNEGSELGFPYGKLFGTTLGDSEVPALGTYDDIELGSLEGFTDETSDGGFEGLLLGARLGLVDGLKIVTYKVTELCF